MVSKYNQFSIMFLEKIYQAHYDLYLFSDALIKLIVMQNQIMQYIQGTVDGDSYVMDSLSQRVF